MFFSALSAPSVVKGATQVPQDVALMATTIFFAFPGGGHVIPTLPIIAELVKRGERVRYFITPEFRAAVEQTGAVFCAYGARFPLANPQNFERFRRSRSGAIQVQLEASQWVLGHFATELAAASPTYVIYDALASWGWYLAKTLGLPSVAFIPTFVSDYQHHAASRTLQVRRLAQQLRQTRARWLARSLSARYHVPIVEPLAQLMQSRGDLNLISTSRELQPNAEAFDAAHFKFIGPSITPRADTTAFPFEQLDARPLLLISLGTAFNQRPEFYQACLQAFADTRWQVVMAVGYKTKLENVPSNFIVRPFVPQLELLKRATLFISHGGMNSVNESLYYNVPLVMIPQGADHGWIAGRVAELGAGIVLGKSATATQLGDATERIAANPAYAEAAARIGTSLRATGGAQAAAGEILRFRPSY
jgi:MGT family glycosyltransferase